MSSFKIGDKVIYIGNHLIDNMFFQKNKTYTISKMLHGGSGVGIGIENVGGYFNVHHFITLSEYRKEKLQQLNNSNVQ